MNASETKKWINSGHSNKTTTKFDEETNYDWKKGIEKELDCLKRRKFWNPVKTPRKKPEKPEHYRKLSNTKRPKCRIRNLSSTPKVSNWSISKVMQCAFGKLVNPVQDHLEPYQQESSRNGPAQFGCKLLCE